MSRTPIRMNAIGAVLAVFGVIVAALGALWLVQGLGVVEIAPVLCVADCEPVIGGSVQWVVTGVVALMAGLVSIRAGLRRIRR